MSKAFAVLALLFSLLMLTIGLMNLDSAKPAVLLLWVVVAFVAGYVLLKGRNNSQ